MPLLFVVGIEQILVLQVIIPAKKDNWSLKASAIGAIVGGALNVLLVTRFQAVGTSLTLLCTESFVAILYIYLVFKTKIVRLQYGLALRHVLCSLPYAGICILATNISSNVWVILCFSIIVSGFYFVISQVFVIRNGLVLNLLARWNVFSKRNV